MEDLERVRHRGKNGEKRQERVNSERRKFDARNEGREGLREGKDYRNCEE